MLLKNCNYLIIIVISLISIPILIYSIKNKKAKNSKIIKIINSFYIAYLILNIFVIPNVLRLDTGFEILFLTLIALFAIVIDIISIFICSKKIKKSNENYSFSKKSLLLIILFIILPILLLLGCLSREYYLINNSDLILIYKSRGNGGLGNNNEFAYAINENYCKEISLGIAEGNYSFGRYLPKKAKKIDNINKLNNYNISLDSEGKYIIVYKNSKIIHKEKINPNYFNIDFDGGFYIDIYGGDINE